MTRDGDSTLCSLICTACLVFYGTLDSTFDLCRAKIEKEKREHAKQHGMIRTEFSGGEIAEEMEKERRLFQLQMCEVRPHKRLLGSFGIKESEGWRHGFISSSPVSLCSIS